MKLDVNDAVNLTVNFKQKLINILIAYRQPSSSKERFIKSLKQVLKGKVKSNEKNIVFLGDININILHTDRKNNDCFHNAEKYENLLASFGFTPKITSETREEFLNGKLCKSCIDHIFTKLADFNSGGIVLKKKVADHYFTVTEIWDDKETNDLGKSNGKVNKLNTKNIIKQLQNFDWSELDDKEEPNALYAKIEKNITEIYNNNKKVVNRTPRRQTFAQPWMTNSLLDKINEKNKLWSKI